MAVIGAIGSWLPRLWNCTNPARTSKAFPEVKGVYEEVGESPF